MSQFTKVAFIVAMVAAFAIPGAAFAASTPTNAGTQNAAAQKGNSTPAPGPKTSASEKANAYGSYCQNQSKMHVAGQTGTPFSKCVTAMAKLATDTTTSPKAACSTLSKKHVAS